MNYIFDIDGKEEQFEIACHEPTWNNPIIKIEHKNYYFYIGQFLEIIYPILTDVSENVNDPRIIFRKIVNGYEIRKDEINEGKYLFIPTIEGKFHDTDKNMTIEFLNMNFKIYQLCSFVHILLVHFSLSGYLSFDPRFEFVRSINPKLKVPDGYPTSFEKEIINHYGLVNIFNKDALLLVGLDKNMSEKTRENIYKTFYEMRQRFDKDIKKLLE